MEILSLQGAPNGSLPLVFYITRAERDPLSPLPSPDTHLSKGLH